jgi:uncharacterized membrane protein
MNALWRFVHYFSAVAWIGGGLAVWVASMTMRRLDRPFWGGIVEVQGACYRMLVGPGAMVNVASGVLLTFGMYGSLSVRVGAWLGTMQGIGVIAALVSLLAAMPSATRLSRLEPTGDTAAAFDRTAARLAITNGIGTLLAALGLLAGALYRG